jgi:Na+/H+ antiporter NhaD/arsenite permease-like protein
MVLQMGLIVEAPQITPLNGAAASTIAGNLTILAAASNIIIIEAAESRGIKAYTFFEYFKIGAIVTLANVIVYYLLLLL